MEISKNYRDSQVTNGRTVKWTETDRTSEYELQEELS